MSYFNEQMLFAISVTGSWKAHRTETPGEISVFPFLGTGHNFGLATLTIKAQEIQESSENSAFPGVNQHNSLGLQ